MGDELNSPLVQRLASRVKCPSRSKKACSIRDGTLPTTLRSNQLPVSDRLDYPRAYPLPDQLPLQAIQHLIAR